MGGGKARPQSSQLFAPLPTSYLLLESRLVHVLVCTRGLKLGRATHWFGPTGYWPQCTALRTWRHVLWD